MWDPDDPIDAERDLARIGLPLDSDVERLSRRFTDALMDACRERLEPVAEPAEPRLVEMPTALEAVRLGL